MEAVAKLRNCPMSPRKMRLVVDNIRGKGVNEALAILKYTKRESGTWLEKVLLSAISNWENKTTTGESAADYDLYVKTAFVDGGTMLKRIHPATHGRAHKIHKRTNHITLVVANRKPVAGIDDVETSAEVEEITAQ
jgi:large subunit ribosomal protein L22